MGDLTGRVALVTGASRGIGAACARGLSAAGAQVIVTDLLDPSAVAAEIGGLARKLDVTSEADWIDTIAFARDRAGGLDILVNNAGIFFMKSLAETSLDDWRRIHAINVEGVFLGCKYAAPLIAERAGNWGGGGSIVNMSSAAGIIGGMQFAAYCSTKGAVRLLSKALAIELAAMRIRVNSVHPGLIETAMGKQVIDDISGANGIGANEARDQMISAHPIGHSGQGANIADGVVFLASDKAAFMTGSEMVIDGGMTAM